MFLGLYDSKFNNNIFNLQTAMILLYLNNTLPAKRSINSAATSRP